MKKLVFFLSLCFLLHACVFPIRERESRVDFYAMDTYMTILAYGISDSLLQQAVGEINALESRISVTKENSAVATLNRMGYAEWTKEDTAFLAHAIDFCRKTEGALDITIYPIIRTWGFTTGTYRVPQPEELTSLLESVDYRFVQINGTNVSLPSGTEIDLGSVAKGYVADQTMQKLREQGVRSALLNFGGNIQTIGNKPNGQTWHIAIQNPEGEGTLGVLAVSDKAVVTSGGYERYFTDDAGNLYWHIMDPLTGMPAKNGLISVTVVGEEGMYCDALSTALFVMGTEQAIAFWQTYRDFEMILVTEDGTLLVSNGLADAFTADTSLRHQIQVIEDD